MYKVTKLLSGDDSLTGDRETRAATIATTGARACIETRRAGALGLGELEDAPYEGSLETWFDDLDSASAFATNESLHRSLWDADGNAEALLVTQPHVVLGDADAEPACEGLKGIFVFRRKAGMSIPAFQSHWLNTHGPIAARTPKTSRYVQCHVLPHQYDHEVPGYDGITELYWDTLEDAAVAMSSDSMTIEQSADAENFVDGGSVKLAVVTSDRLI